MNKKRLKLSFSFGFILYLNIMFLSKIINQYIMAIKKDKAQERYYDYVLIYTNTINEYSDELNVLCKKKRSWEVKLGKRKHTYFSITNGVTILNRKNDLEMTFSFNTDEENVYFEKYKLNGFIESDLNSSGLGKDFSSNKKIRAEDYEEYFSKILMSWMIRKQWDWYIISKDELY
jgi:hypothetical protein